MASGDESQKYMDKVPNLRKKFLDKHYASDKNYFDSRDIARTKSDDAFVHQFLVGREGNLDKAHKLMIEAIKWRKEFGINDLTAQDIPEEVFKSGFLYMYGKDKYGASLVFLRTTKFIHDKSLLLGYKKLLALTYEKTQREGGKLSIVTNSKDAGLSNVDTNFNSFSAFLQSTAYPDILENGYILNLPVLLEGVWKVLKGLLGKRLSSKFVFTNEEELATKYADKDQLPTEYGGPSFEYKYPPEEKADKNSNEPAVAIEAS